MYLLLLLILKKGLQPKKLFYKKLNIEMMKNKFLSKLLLVAFFVTLGSVTFAQPPAGPPPGGSVTSGNTPPCWDPQCVPVDGGLGFLIAAGALFGIRKLKGKA